MRLTPIAFPELESELPVMLCTLEAHGIPASVQAAGFGTLYPGPQIASYNARRVLVPESLAGETRAALQFMSEPYEYDADSPAPEPLRLGMFIEFVCFGWFVPSSKRRSRSELE